MPGDSGRSLSVSGIAVAGGERHVGAASADRPCGRDGACSAELELVPFDIPEAETEIVAGWRTEFTGRRLALFRMGRDLEIVLVSALVVSLYLGGAQQLWLVPAAAMFVIKTAAVVAVFSFARALFARFRIDQMIAGMWKYLLPIAVAQVVLVQMGLGV